jgi:hypothetical protein
MTVLPGRGAKRSIDSIAIATHAHSQAATMRTSASSSRYARRHQESGRPRLLCVKLVISIMPHLLDQEMAPCRVQGK